MDDGALWCLNFTAVKKKDLQPTEIVELLQPLIPLTLDSRSTYALKNDPEKFAEELKAKGKPITLTHKGTPIALLCDLDLYKQIEKRRQRIVALLEGVTEEFIATAGARRLSPSEHQTFRELKQCVATVEKLERDIDSHKCGLYDAEEKLKEAIERKCKLLSAIVPVSLTNRMESSNLETA
jgi:hypothetical protein